MRLINYDDPKSLVSRIRRRRSRHLRAMIVDVAARKGDCQIIDIGGEARYWLMLFGADWLRERRVFITLINHTDEYVGQTLAHDLFQVVLGDGCNVPFKDHSFDIAHSNSVIEHVGEWGRQRRFADELRRVGRQYYLQTPARCFPLEPHTRFPLFQYLPSRWRVWLLMRAPLGAYPRLDAEWAHKIDRELALVTYHGMVSLFPDAWIRRERLCGFTKSYMAVSIGYIVA